MLLRSLLQDVHIVQRLHLRIDLGRYPLSFVHLNREQLKQRLPRHVQNLLELLPELLLLVGRVVE